MTPKVAVVILAAGASTRMGVPKQLLPWGNSSLLSYVIHTASALNEEVHVILGAHSEVIKPEIPKIKKVYAHTNPEWEEGIGNSIAFAIRSLEDLKLDGILFLLADQPFVTRAYLEEIQGHFTENTTSIVVSEFKRNLGVPVLFPSVYFNELSTLNADVGAKQIIKKHSDKIIKLDANQYVRDIDTLIDYQNAHDIQFGNHPTDL